MKACQPIPLNFTHVQVRSSSEDDEQRKEFGSDFESVKWRSKQYQYYKPRFDKVCDSFRSRVQTPLRKDANLVILDDAIKELSESSSTHSANLHKQTRLQLEDDFKSLREILEGAHKQPQ